MLNKNTFHSSTIKPCCGSKSNNRLIEISRAFKWSGRI